MKISMICFSMTGWETGERLRRGFLTRGDEVCLAGKSKYLPDSMTESVKDWTGKQFLRSEGIIFIGACGIAVRSIAPYVIGKKTDPAVLVIDECGKFVISLLSGHLGGANELALEAAGILGALPVVTTATDLHQQFAVDVFARKNHCEIFCMKAAKEVSAALLAGEKTGFYSEFPWEGELPDGLVACDGQGMPLDGKTKKPETGVAVTIYKKCQPFASTTQVVPPVVTLGIGCRKGKEAEGILEASKNSLQALGIYQKAVEGIASIDLKKDEAGILALSGQWEVPFHTFSGEELLAVPGDFTPSSFVKTVTGVENVCERSAVLASGQGKLIQKKIGGGGVTTAAAVRDWRIRFE